LITRPEWYQEQGDKKIRALNNQFQAFGDSIGPDNLAVWFLPDLPQHNSTPLADLERCVAFCKSFDLKPSEGPYVVVLSEYPGECVVGKAGSFPAKTAKRIVIKLNQTDADESAKLLSRLVDGIVLEDLSKVQKDTDSYWTVWRKIFQGAVGVIVSVSQSVTVSIEAGPITAEIDLRKK
jgi:hypothetical protein